MPRILLVDDDDFFRNLTYHMLIAAGYDVQDAANGRVGLACYRHQPSDVVITDLLMPGTEGLEMIRELRRHDAGVKIIAMSAEIEGRPTAFSNSPSGWGPAGSSQSRLHTTSS